MQFGETRGKHTLSVPAEKACKSVGCIWNRGSGDFLYLLAPSTVSCASYLMQHTGQVVTVSISRAVVCVYFGDSREYSVLYCTVGRTQLYSVAAVGSST